MRPWNGLTIHSKRFWAALRPSERRDAFFAPSDMERRNLIGDGSQAAAEGKNRHHPALSAGELGLFRRGHHTGVSEHHLQRRHSPDHQRYCGLGAGGQGAGPARPAAARTASGGASGRPPAGAVDRGGRGGAGGGGAGHMHLRNAHQPGQGLGGLREEDPGRPVQPHPAPEL